MLLHTFWMLLLLGDCQFLKRDLIVNNPADAGGLPTLRKIMLEKTTPENMEYLSREVRGLSNKVDLGFK